MKEPSITTDQKDLEQLDPDLLLEAVAEVALGEDAHLDQQLALLLAGAADRLERVVALLLGDEALVGEDLAEELGRHVAAHERRATVDEEHHLLGLAGQQVEVAGAARAGDVADEVREGHALEGSLGREAEVAVGGCLRGHGAAARPDPVLVQGEALQDTPVRGTWGPPRGRFVASPRRRGGGPGRPAATLAEFARAGTRPHAVLERRSARGRRRGRAPVGRRPGGADQAGRCAGAPRGRAAWPTRMSLGTCLAGPAIG